MASRTKQYDKNRFRKVYPRFRAEPRPGLLVGSGDVVLESVALDFTNQDQKSVTLEGPYTSLPGLSVTAVDVDGNDQSDINVFISSAVLQSVPSSGGKSVLVTVNTSAAFTGHVHLQAVQA